ncbi:hypothetical protein BJF78_09630 [Pseudonocardia sp. CNS-139]|nr:hypothetical protein BJF78_09630 [Pseudonocardia sp. CNS-139]
MPPATPAATPPTRPPEWSVPPPEPVPPPPPPQPLPPPPQPTQPPVTSEPEIEPPGPAGAERRGNTLALEPGGPQLGHPNTFGTDHDFGDVPVGSAGPPLTIELGNDLDHDFEVIGVRPADPNGPGDFTLTEDGCLGAVLDPGDTCPVGVAFVPAGAGPSQVTVEARLRHTCTATDYWPCRWQPDPGTDGGNRNFERLEQPDGSVVFEWTAALTDETGIVALTGTGTA